MTKYYATARSNFFAVKDERAFRDWANSIGLAILIPTRPKEPADDVPRFGICPGDGEGSGGWPVFAAYEETQDHENVDFHEQLAAHLAEGEVAVLIEVGSEEFRYLTGTALAVNHKGECVTLDLNSIYEQARVLGPNITRAEY